MGKGPTGLVCALILILGGLLCLVREEEQGPKAEAKLTDPLGYVCYRATKPIVIDGKLDDEDWAKAPWSSDFADIEGDTKPKPRYRTRMKMLWDDENLYIAAELEEPHVWSNVTEHDAIIFQDPDFEVFIDPDGDNHLYAEFEMNARNTTWDLLLSKPYKDGGFAINGWEIMGLKTAVHIDGTLNDPKDKDRGWTVEIAWPWKGLQELSKAHTLPRDGDQWRINFSRVEWDIDIVNGKYEKVKGQPEHNWVWSPQGVIDMHRPERWGYVQFSTGEPGKAAYRPDPAQATKDILHKLYYAQKDYLKAHGKYAATLAELGLTFPVEPKMEVTSNTFEASLMQAATEGKKPRKWTIMHDSRIWSGE